MIYLIFNEGYVATSGDSLTRHELCGEAIRLGRVLVALLPESAEARGLLALMLLHDSRRETRLNAAGELVLLDEQDRTRWDQAKIHEGIAVLDEALALGDPGPYQVQAAISALHAEAATPDATDWPQIAALYNTLAVMMPSPVVEVNRAVAVAMAAGSDRWFGAAAPDRGRGGLLSLSRRSRRSAPADESARGCRRCLPASARPVRQQRRARLSPASA